MSLNDIPEVSFVETDVNVIFENIKNTFENQLGRKLYPSDPLLILIQTFATIVSQQASKMKYIARQNLVKYSDDDYIENLGALVGVERLKPTRAYTTLKFTISEAQNSVILVPKGTRVTTGNKVYFETTENAQFLVSETEITVSARCTLVGTIGNGFSIGQVNNIVDLFPYFKSVSNITVSNSGTDLEDLENYRGRIFSAPDSFSVAGPNSAYKFWAKSTNALISDVSVFSPSPGVVELIPLLINGEIPSSDILQAVYDYCSADDKRPLTDNVEVKAPSVKNYNIDIVYYISNENLSNAKTISNKVNETIESYILWQKEKLGRDVNPSKLTEILMKTGIKRVEILEPAFDTLNYYEVALCENTNINFGGVENE